MTSADAVERVRRSVRAEVLSFVGPRWALVVSGPGGPGEAAGGAVVRPSVVVSLDASPRGPGAVRGAADAIPVLSEALTGVVVEVPEGAAAALAVPECARLLQPGGAVVLWSTWRADEVPGLDAVCKAAGLEVRRRVAVCRADEPPPAAARWWPSVVRRRAASSEGATRVECAVVAVRPGSGLVEVPSAGNLLAEMFVPRPWRARPRPPRP